MQHQNAFFTHSMDVGEQWLQISKMSLFIATLFARCVARVYVVDIMAGQWMEWMTDGVWCSIVHGLVSEPLIDNSRCCLQSYSHCD